jgi:hypothetical protein
MLEREIKRERMKNVSACTGQRERERERERDLKRERRVFILKGMTVALAPFSYLVI